MRETDCRVRLKPLLCAVFCWSSLVGPVCLFSVPFSLCVCMCVSFLSMSFFPLETFCETFCPVFSVTHELLQTGPSPLKAFHIFSQYLFFYRSHYIFFFLPPGFLEPSFINLTKKMFTKTFLKVKMLLIK